MNPRDFGSERVKSAVVKKIIAPEPQIAALLKAFSVKFTIQS